MSVRVHPFLEGAFTGKHTAEKILDILNRHAGEMVRLDGGDDPRTAQLQKHTAVLPSELLDAGPDGRLSRRWKATAFHLLIEMVAHPRDAARGQPTPQIVGGAADGSETIVLQDPEHELEGAAKELLPPGPIQMFDQRHPPPFGRNDRCAAAGLIRPGDGAPPIAPYCTVMSLMTTGVTGASWWLPCCRVSTPAIASTTSMPSVTRPKTA